MAFSLRAPSAENSTLQKSPCHVKLHHSTSFQLIIMLNWHMIRLHTDACKNYTFVELTYITQNFLSFLDIQYVSYLGWKKPEKQIRVEFLVHRKITRETSNVFRSPQRTYSCCFLRFLNLTGFYQRSKKQGFSRFVFGRNLFYFGVDIHQTRHGTQRRPK